MVNRKYREQLTIQLPARIMIISNEVPRLDDASGAIASRMMILQTKNSFYGSENTHLLEHLLAERTSILFWAIRGWRSLRKQGRFFEPKTSIKLREQMTCLSSPILRFIEDCCRLDPNRKVKETDLFQAYRRWCEQNGLRNKSAETFRNDLETATEGKVQHKRMSQTYGRQRMAIGISVVARPSAP